MDFPLRFALFFTLVLADSGQANECSQLIDVTNGSDSSAFVKCTTRALNPRLSDSSAPNCKIHDLETSYLKEPQIHDCSNPIELMCQPQTNQFVAKVTELKETFKKLVKNKDQFIPVQKFIESKIPSSPFGFPSRHCFEFLEIHSSADEEECSRIASEELLNTVATESRKQRARDLLSSLKAEIILFLETRRLSQS